MKKRNKKNFLIAICLLGVFILFTLFVIFIDVKPIGPEKSRVGFALINDFVHKATGVHMALYNLTDWLSVVPIMCALFWAILGLIQWIKRKKILKVDYKILILGVIYILTILAYVFFEKVVINYRPVLIDGSLESSYPSSTTMLVIVVMSTTIIQTNDHIKNKVLNSIISILVIIFILFMVVLRLVSGVHWFTDIIGGLILSATLITLYNFIIHLK